MVIIIFQDDYAMSFEMSSWDKERALLARFKSGNLKPNTVLDLKSKGTFKISEIKDMEFSPTKVLKKEVEEEEENEDFKKAVQDSKPQDYNEKLAEFQKSFGESLKKKS